MDLIMEFNIVLAGLFLVVGIVYALYRCVRNDSDD